MTESGNRFGNWCLKLAFVLAGCACPLVAQSTDVARSISTEEEIRLLRAELTALRSEVNGLKEELHRGAAQNARTSDTVAQGPQSTTYSASTHQVSATSASNSASASTAAGASNGG